MVQADPASDLEFKVELELLPDIVPPDLSGITLTRLKAEVSDEAVEKSLAELAKRQRKLVPVEEERGAAEGDVLTIDFAGKVDNEAFAGGTGTDMNVDIGGAGFIPGFAEQLVGLKVGESRTLEVTFPDPYPRAELSGKPATFEVTAKALQAAEVPPLDDELAKTLGFEGGLTELRDTVRTQLQREYDDMARIKLKRALLDALAERASFAVPETMVEPEFGQIWQRVETDLKQGTLDAEDQDKDEDTLRAEYRAIAERRVRLGLLLAEIGRTNSIQVTEQEMMRAARMAAMRYPGQERQVLEFFSKNPQAAESLRGPIFEDKVVDFVIELATVEDQVVTPEELIEQASA
jgi:trigger factor